MKDVWKAFLKNWWPLVVILGIFYTVGLLYCIYVFSC